MKCQGKLPFQIFPGIFSSIDSMTKKVVAVHYQKYNRVPDWLKPFGPLGEPLPVPHHSKFQTLDTKTNCLLTGTPDALFRRPDGTLVILDNKTSRFTNNQDKLLPMYATQVNAYARIAERIGMGRVSGLGLIYFEPLTDVDASTIDSVVLDNGFAMKFNAKLLPLTLEPKSIPPLLRRVRAIHDLPTPPDGWTGCKDCLLLDGLVKIETSPKTKTSRI